MSTKTFYAIILLWVVGGLWVVVDGPNWLSVVLEVALLATVLAVMVLAMQHRSDFSVAASPARPTRVGILLEWSPLLLVGLFGLAVWTGVIPWEQLPVRGEPEGVRSRSWLMLVALRENLSEAGFGGLGLAGVALYVLVVGWHLWRHGSLPDGEPPTHR